ncbi:P22AR C-terminal domain-containing protein [Enterobacter asburiae]|uniref:P22AR C-terminal domain-containing protein n=1 Tax=Enterobacter asburiae TaxID=61645 RepID=UPI003B438BA2
MVTERSEAQKCANTLGLLSNKSRKGNIDMNIVAKSDLNFQGKALVPVSNITGTWLTSSDLAMALQYSNSRAVTMIYNKYADEFTNGMTQVLEVSTSGNYRKKVRVFSLRGAHLIAMFARTPVAKDFRRWVLDILDREVQHSPISKQFTDKELCDLAWLWRAGAVMITACREIYPLLKVAEHRQAGHFYSIGHEFSRTLNKGREVLKRETAHIEFQPWKDDNWSRVLPHLRQEMLQ